MKIQQQNYINYSNQNNINFGALYKKDLTQFQRVFAKMHKVPIREMNDVKEISTWAEDKFVKDVNIETGVGTKLLQKEWINKMSEFFKKHIEDASLWKATIYDYFKNPHPYGIPLFDAKALKKTINDLMSNQIKNHESFNFLHQYEHNLKEQALEKYFPNSQDRTGWVKISQIKDYNKEIESVNDARKLSLGTNWCTKLDLYSRICLEDGDFFIYLKNGKTELGIRTHKNMTYEIKNRHNVAEYDEFTEELNEFFEKYPYVIKYHDNHGMEDD